MNKNKVRLLVSMPGKIVMDDMVEMVILSAEDGYMGILQGHEPMSVILGYGPLRTRKEGDISSATALTVMGGYATIRDDFVNVLTPIADTPEHIGAAVDAIIKDREQNIKYENTANLEISRAEMALKNILIRRDDTSFIVPKIYSGNDGPE